MHVRVTYALFFSRRSSDFTAIMRVMARTGVRSFFKRLHVAGFFIAPRGAMTPMGAITPTGAITRMITVYVHTCISVFFFHGAIYLCASFQQAP